MSITRKSVMTVYCWPLTGLFIALALLFMSIQTQEAYAERKKVSGTCKVITHPNGDQTFFQYKGKREPIGTGPYDYTWKIEGFFIKGTGKFKGITGSVVAKGKTSMAEKTWEWEAEYEIR